MGDKRAQIWAADFLNPSKAGKTAEYRQIIVLYDCARPLLKCLLVTYSVSLVERLPEEELTVNSDARKAVVAGPTDRGFGAVEAGSTINNESRFLQTGTLELELSYPLGSEEYNIDKSGQLGELSTDDELDSDYDEPDSFWEWDQKLEKWRHHDGDTGEWLLCPDSLD